MRRSIADTDAEQAHLRLLEPGASLHRRQLKVCHVAARAAFSQRSEASAATARRVIRCCTVAIMARSVDAREVWARLQRGEAELLDLRTVVERRRFGAPPGAKSVSLGRHVVRPAGPPVIYLCQHAVRSKATLWRGASEIAGGFVAWQHAGLPVDDVKD